MPAFDMFVDGAIASSTATLFSNPFDLMRTRLQIQGELQREGEYKVLYRNLPQGMWRVARTEGVMALQKGLLAGVLWQFTQNGIRVGLYQEVKDRLEAALLDDSPTTGANGGNSNSSGGNSSSGAKSIPKNTGTQMIVGLMSGGFTGFAGSLASSPFSLVKTRLQIQSAGESLAVGRQFGYKGVVDALISIYREGGVRGLWRGCFIAGQREFAVSMVQFTTYDACKRGLHNRYGLAYKDSRMHLISAFFGSVAIVAFTNPLSVVQTRAYNASKHGEKFYTNNLPLATWRIMRVEGVKGLYKGSTAFFSRSAPHAMITFVTLEYIRDKRRQNSFSYQAFICEAVTKAAGKD